MIQKSLICAAGLAVFLGAAALATRPEAGGHRLERAVQDTALRSGSRDGGPGAGRETPPIEVAIPRGLPEASALALLALLVWVGLLTEFSLRNIEAAAAEELSAAPIAAVIRRRARQDAAAARSSHLGPSLEPLRPPSAPGSRRGRGGSPGISAADLELDGCDEPLDVNRGERLARTLSDNSAFAVVTDTARQKSIRASNNVTEIKP